MSPRTVPPNPHLKEQDCEQKTSRPAQGIGAEKQDGDLGFPLHPSMMLPATGVPNHTRDHRPGPTEKHKTSWEGTSPGRRAATASRSYIPFEAMSAHAHTGRHATKLPHHTAPTPRGLSAPPPASRFNMPPAYVPRRNVPNAESQGGSMAGLLTLQKV